MTDRLRLIEKIEFIKRDAEAGHQWANPRDIYTLCDMALASLDETRAPIPATPDRMADVTLGAWEAWHKEHCGHEPNWCAGPTRIGELCGYCQALHLAATVTLPDAKGEAHPFDDKEAVWLALALISDDLGLDTTRPDGIYPAEPMKIYEAFKASLTEAHKPKPLCAACMVEACGEPHSLAHKCGKNATTPSADRMREKALREGYLLAMADGFPMTASEAGQMERLIQEALNKKGEA